MTRDNQQPRTTQRHKKQHLQAQPPKHTTKTKHSPPHNNHPTPQSQIILIVVSSVPPCCLSLISRSLCSHVPQGHVRSCKHILSTTNIKTYIHDFIQKSTKIRARLSSGTRIIIISKPSSTNKYTHTQSKIPAHPRHNNTIHPTNKTIPT